MRSLLWHPSMMFCGVFFFKQKTAYEMLRSLVGSEMCIRDRFLSDYSEDQEALLESAVINFKSRGVTTLVITGEMLYKQADYLFPHAIAQSPFGRPLLSKMELDMLCLLYTSDAADDLLCVDLGGRRIIKQKNKSQK